MFCNWDRDDMAEDAEPPESLLPYDRWTEAAMREVAIRALEHAAEHGLPGEHHFYLTFRTDRPDVAMPAFLRAKYRDEMTIVLQHQYKHLRVDRGEARFSVELVFGGAPATLSVPFEALTAFWDPHVRVGLRFAAAAEPEPASEAPPPGPAEAPVPEGPAQIVSLDAFRRKPRE
jgi:hypothetical protein